MALAADGNLYVTEVSGAVRRLNLATQTVSLVNTNTTLDDLWGIAMAPSGDLLVLRHTDDTHRPDRSGDGRGDAADAIELALASLRPGPAG